jgi:hypothetical protein
MQTGSSEDLIGWKFGKTTVGTNGGSAVMDSGDLKCREVKTGFSGKRQMQTGSSEALIGWKFGKTPVGPNGGSVAMEYLWV